MYKYLKNRFINGLKFKVVVLKLFLLRKENLLLRIFSLDID